LIDIAVSRLRKFTTVFDVKISVDKLKISIEDVFSGMSNITPSIDAHFKDTIHDIFLRLSDKCQINAGYVLYPADFDQDRKKNIKIGNTFFNMGKIVTSQLKNSEQAAVFACTIGPGMENWSRAVLEENEPALGYLIDMTASAVTEKSVDYLHDLIGVQMADKNLNITNRYSPGYCDWPASDQHLLFSLMPEKFCGIILNDSAMMNPIKSISGVVGIGTDVKFKDYPCDRCNIKVCTHRTKRIKTLKAIN